MHPFNLLNLALLGHPSTPKPATAPPHRIARPINAPTTPPTVPVLVNLLPAQLEDLSPQHIDLIDQTSARKDDEPLVAALLASGLSTHDAFALAERNLAARDLRTGAQLRSPGGAAST